MLVKSPDEYTVVSGEYITAGVVPCEDTPLPSVADTSFFQCMNMTIGESIPHQQTWQSLCFVILSPFSYVVLIICRYIT